MSLMFIINLAYTLMVKLTQEPHKYILIQTKSLNVLSVLYAGTRARFHSKLNFRPLNLFEKSITTLKRLYIAHAPVIIGLAT